MSDHVHDWERGAHMNAAFGVDGRTFACAICGLPKPKGLVTTDELDRIERLARAATHGPWDWMVAEHVRDGLVIGPDGDAFIEVRWNPAGRLGPDEQVNTAAYIAALSPDVVTRLTAAARASTGEHDCSACRRSRAMRDRG